MTSDQLRALLQDVSSGAKSIDRAIQALSQTPAEENLGFARVDHHRALRQGFPEVVFGQGKTPDQIVAISQRLEEAGVCSRDARERGSLGANRRAFATGRL
jgi:NCAIR mutase (PurE)-related protein